MTDISKYIDQLKSSSKDKRYEACEFLRVAENIPESALLTLEEATHDPDPDVVDAAKRALLRHKPSPPQSIDTMPRDVADNISTVDTPIPTQKSWALSFIGYGVLAGLPIPCIGWLWIILSVYSATKLGWAKGAMGIALFFGTAIATRIVIGLLLYAFSGN